MSVPDHHCWWTNRRTCELSRRGSDIFGAGLPRSVLAGAARHLGVALAITTAPLGEAEEDDDEVIMLGTWSGGLHDGCFVHFERCDSSLAEALVAGAMELHAGYLGVSLEPDLVRVVSERLGVDTAVRLRSVPARGELLLESWPVDAGWWTRRITRASRLR